MFGQDSARLSTYPDRETSATSTPYFFESHGTHDRQKVAASNSLCSMSQIQEPDSTEIPNSQNDFRFHSSRTPSSFPAYEHTTWNDRHPCTAPPAPELSGFRDAVAHGHMANQNHPFHYADQGYDESAMPSLPTIDDLPALGPSQQHTPPSETSTVPLSGPSTPYLPISAISRSFNSTPASSVEPEHGEWNCHIPAMEQVNKSAGSISSAPYAKLIERALLEAEGNRLLLKDIYTWIEINTNKASNPSSNGWKNSVRHNLSMNGAFTKVEVQSRDSKSQKAYMWMLEPSAKKYGIESTTRFRRKNDIKRRSRNFPVNDRRAQSGRRGGWASQKSAHLQKGSQLAAMWQSSQELEDENSGYSGFESLQTIAPGSVPAGYYQPFLPPPPPQHYSTQVAEGYTYDEPSTYAGTAPVTQFASYPNNARPQMWPALTSTVAHQPANEYSGF